MKLYEPINILKIVAENIWIVDSPIVKMSMYGTKTPFPTRMTVIKLSNGDLWCHSPTLLTPNLKKEIDQLGPVKHLISPNKIHLSALLETLTKPVRGLVMRGKKGRVLFKHLG